MAAGPIVSSTGFARNVEYVGRTIWVSIFSVASTLIAPVLLTHLPQGQELLNTVTDDQLLPFNGHWNGPLHNGWLLFALLAWALANWWGSRLLLQRDFLAPEGAGGAPVIAGFSYQWNLWFPRTLGFIGIAWIDYYILVQRKQWIAGLAGLGILILYTLIVVFRRKIFPVAAATRRQALQTGDRIALWLALALSTVLLWTLTHINWWMAHFLGTPGILLLGLGSLVLVGAVILTYLPFSYGWPSLAWLPFVMAFVLGLTDINRNHGIAVRLIADPAPDSQPRPSVLQHLGEWLQQDEHKSGPIILVAAEGGASRSAWWTSHVLTVLDYVTQGEFSKHVYAVSGVSGGSLGAATYVALLAEQPSINTTATRAPTFPTQQDCWEMRFARSEFPLPMQSECFLERDFLATTLGYMLFPDLLQRILPAREPGWDRSLGLEQTWQIDWRMLFNPPSSVQGAAQDSFTKSLDALYTRNGKVRTDLPVLFLNSTRAEAGRAVLQSPVSIPSTEIDDLFDARLHTRGLPLSDAVHNSARFPLVSPGGEVETSDHKPWDALVDGGYFENSGAATLAEFIKALKNCAASPQAAPCPSTVSDWNAVLSRFHVVFIMNDPDNARSILPQRCTAQPPPAQDPLFGPRKPINEEELLTPLEGLYNPRSARGDSSKRFLLSLLPDPCQATEIFLVPHPHITDSYSDTPIDEPAMSWYLNPASRTVMWRAVQAQSDALCSVVKNIDARFESSCPAQIGRFQDRSPP